MSILQQLLEKFEVCEEVEMCHLVAHKYFPELRASEKAIDVVAMVKKAGIELQEVNESEFEGKFEWDSHGREMITLGGQNNTRRRRFTAAHELGHWLIRQVLTGQSAGVKYRDSKSDGSKISEEERIANLLAAEILMPFTTMMRLLRHDAISIPLINQLSARFQVSRTAVFRRIAQILNTTLIYLNVIPNRFNDLGSHAIIDDAIYVVPARGLIFDRDNPRLLKRIPFADFLNKKSIFMGIRGSHGRVLTHFDVATASKPIPNADLLAVDVVFQQI